MTARADTFHIVASLPSHDGKPERHIGWAKDLDQVAVLHMVVGRWEIKAGPWTFATWSSCAERIVAGDAKALTWPDAQLCLAAGILVFQSGLVAAEQTVSAAGSSNAPTADRAPPAPVQMPSSLSPAGLPFDPPQDPRCAIAGCGE